MATYVNNLRLTELATGEGSGTWGTTTNTNLELIGEALGYGSEAIANASTHTITVADGTADSARSFYLKLTGGGQACTVTLAPNTLSKVWMVENTTNSTLTFSQGSGANVAVPAGQVKMIATDGAGSGAVVYDLLVDTDLTGTTTVVNLTSSGTIDAATVEFNSLSGTGSVAITDILDQDNMSSDSATALATQQSIKAYVDSSVASFDTLAEVLAQGNTTGSTDIEVTTAQKVQFRDSAIYINSSADGQLDIVADTEIQIAATTIDANGNLDVSGTIAAGGVVTANAGVVVDHITIDGFTLTSTSDIVLDSAFDIIFDADANDVLFKDGGTEYFRITNNGTSFVRLDSVGDIILDADGGDIYLDDGGTGFGQISGVSSNLTIKSSTADKDIIFQGNDGGSSVTALTLDMSAAGAATFNDSVTAGSDIEVRSGNKLILQRPDNAVASNISTDSTGAMILDSLNGEGFFFNNNGTNAFKIDPINATFAGTVTANAGVVVDNFTLDGTTLALSSGNMALDSAGHILLDANSGEIAFQDSGTTFLEIANSSSNAIIRPTVQDKDILFNGNDGGAAITALTLDMSAAGAATFNSNVGIGLSPSTWSSSSNALQIGSLALEDYTVSGANVSVFYNNAFRNASDNIVYIESDFASTYSQYNGEHSFSVAPSGTAGATISLTQALKITQSEIVANDGSADRDFRVESSGNANMLFVDGGNNHIGIGTATLNRSGLGSDHIVLTVGADTQMGMLELQGTRTSNADLGRVSFLNAGTRRAEIVAARVDEDNSTKLYFQTSNAGTLGTKLTIGKDGKIAIGNDIPIWSGSYGGAVFLKGNNATAARNARLCIVNSTGAQDGDKELILDNDGDVTVKGGDLIFGTAGKGVVLGATTNTAANTLDDYEEGTFTPTFIGSTGNPTVNYNTQVGSYTKIGNTVTYTIFIVTNSRSGGSGHLSVGGLPFTVGLNQDYGSTIGFNYNWVSGEYPQHAIAQNGQTHVLLYKDGSSNTPSNPDDILASGNSYLRLTGFYYTTA